MTADPRDFEDRWRTGLPPVRIAGVRVRVAVGMSGGVDSAVTAMLLTQAGYEVEGITLRLWADDDRRDKRWQERTCCKIGLARYVADRLGIPHRVIEAESPFRKAVVDEFVSDYREGRTPNPCVRCNERVKFRLLLEAAVESGADYLATGHYVRRAYKETAGTHLLRRALDERKDQSYFLYRLPAEAIERTLFPLGAVYKQEVWRCIEPLGLPAEELHESQEVCFVTQGNYRDFIREQSAAAARPGPIVDEEGRRLGEHEGVAFYTVGQRRGLGVSGGERLYVIGLEPRTDTVVMGHEEALYRRDCVAEDLRLLEGPITRPREVWAKIRYRTPAAQAVIEPVGEDRLAIRFDEPQRAITPGQSVVFYEGDWLIGGGVIANHGGPTDPVDTGGSAW